MAVLTLRRAALIAAALLALVGGARPRAGAAAPTEYQVKAVFLFNFSQFVDWPPASFADGRSPLVIGVLGRDPFGATLDEIVRGETVNGRPLVVRRYESIDAGRRPATSCSSTARRTGSSTRFSRRSRVAACSPSAISRASRGTAASFVS